MDVDGDWNDDSVEEPDECFVILRKGLTHYRTSFVGSSETDVLDKRQSCPPICWGRSPPPSGKVLRGELGEAACAARGWCERSTHQKPVQVLYASTLEASSLYVGVSY